MKIQETSKALVKLQQFFSYLIIKNTSKTLIENDNFVTNFIDLIKTIC